MFGSIRFISDRFKKSVTIGWRDYTCFRLLTTYLHRCWLRSGANSGLLPFLPESLGSNVSLLPFGPVLAGPARKPVVRHRGSRLHGKELSAVLATIRHVLSFFSGFPVRCLTSDKRLARLPHLARAIHRAALSASAKRCERIQSSLCHFGCIYPDSGQISIRVAVQFR